MSGEPRFLRRRRATILPAVALVIQVMTCGCDDGPVCPTPDEQVVDANNDGYDDGDYQFLLDLVALAGTEIEPLELGDQEWNDRRLTRLVVTSEDAVLTGPFPSSVGFLTAIRHLGMFDHQFEGSIPSTIGRLESVELLQLDGIGVSGEIPREIGRLRNLRGLFLRWNALTGVIPPSVAAIPLDRAGFSGNRLTGALPTFDTTNLEILFLDDNQFRGEPLEGLVTATKLRYLNLSGNDFTGPVPDGFADIPDLVELKLHSNRFNGVIPSWVCENRGPPIVTVADNAFCEPYPPCLDATALGQQDCDPAAGSTHGEAGGPRPAHMPE